jgi:hypothetical protein
LHASVPPVELGARDLAPKQRWAHGVQADDVSRRGCARAPEQAEIPDRICDENFFFREPVTRVRPRFSAYATPKRAGPPEQCGP